MSSSSLQPNGEVDASQPGVAAAFVRLYKQRPGLGSELDGQINLVERRLTEVVEMRFGPDGSGWSGWRGIVLTNPREMNRLRGTSGMISW
jgi:hypothetical protein